MDEMTARGRKAGLAFITLEVRRSNAAARELYRGKGFIDVGERKNYYESPREDAILMTLFLK
jgi:ribosomal-protein-alanine N-acetyltransferase